MLDWGMSSVVAGIGRYPRLRSAWSLELLDMVRGRGLVLYVSLLGTVGMDVARWSAAVPHRAFQKVFLKPEDSVPLASGKARLVSAL